MARYFCQDRPDVLQLEAQILEVRPGAVLVARSPFFPGGGGQLADRGHVEWAGGRAPITGTTADARGFWHEFEGAEEPHGSVVLTVDADFRRLMSELHTLAHVANSIVFRECGGALLTGAQLGADGTFRVDFDVPGAETDRLRALDGPINDVIRQDLPVRTFWMPWRDAEAETGLFRSKSAAPPPHEDGTVRIVEIVSLDRQACGGTHLASTGEARPVRVLKVDNKGRQNRRIKVGFADQA